MSFYPDSHSTGLGSIEDDNPFADLPSKNNTVIQSSSFDLNLNHQQEDEQQQEEAEAEEEEEEEERTTTTAATATATATGLTDFSSTDDDQELGFDGKPIIIPDHHLSSFTSSAAITTTGLDLDYQTSPDQQLFKFNNDQLESSYQEPFQDLIPSSSSSSSNQFNYQSTNSSPNQLTQSVPEQQLTPQQHHHPETEQHQTIPASELPPEPQPPLFRPFGVSATLTSSSNITDHLDQPISPSNPTTSSRPALPDILGGGSLAGSLLLPDSRASLPAFKKSSPKSSKPIQKNENNQPALASNSNSPSRTQPKPYRPLGLKIPQPKPIIINPEPPAASNTEPAQNQKTVEPQSNQSTRATSPPPQEQNKIEPDATSTAIASSSDQSNPNDHPDPQQTQKDAVDPSKDTVKDEEEDPEGKGKEVVSPTSPSGNPPVPQETKTGLSIVVPPPSSLLPSLVPTNTVGDHPQAIQPVQNSGPSDGETQDPPREQSAPDPSADAPPQAVQTDQPGPEQKPAHPPDSDSEDERPLASVREGLVQQQQQQQQQGRAPLSRPNSSSLPGPNLAQYPTPTPVPTAPLPLYKCSVGDPQKMGMINDIHTVYTVKTVATDPNSSGPLKASSTVLRRFRDFVWLFDALVSNNPGIIVPPIPDKNLRHRFQEGFIAARRVALEFFLQKTVNHPMLTSDPDLKLFLESDAFGLEIKHRKHDSSPQTGWLANIAGPRFVETDEFFENRKVALDTLEGQLKVLQASLTAASKARRAMAQSLSELAEGLQVLSTSDLSKPVRNTIERLAGLHRQAHQWALDQATNELESLITTVEAYARLTNSVRLTFNGRVKSWDKLQYAINHLKKIQSNHEKIKRSCSPNDQSTALMYSLAELEEAERRAHEARNEFADVSKLIKAEFQRFDQEKVEDFKLSICSFVDGLTDRQRQIVKVWQEYYQVLQVLSKQNADANSAPHHPNNSKNDNGSSKSNTNQSEAVQPSTQKTTTSSSAVVPEAGPEPHPSSSAPDPTSASSVENLTRDLDLNKDHESSFSPSESHDQHDLLQEQQPLIVPDDAAVWADVSKSDPSPPSSSQLENHAGLPSYDHDDHP
ncbi:Vacuolar protein sorting-associated protein 5 [Puccinia graminis f. sp. tritici]|uniref:Vacuolar protein sorting-associated protein 5 n=1 Tax=Puccinia graminis f. sp. tritici TaxID=56615 RepID=A0A5B0NBU0_PUCGR|nr:Vacuolar protein sorting-associated protein 5 [Puccinia graminis f. sp. tritici]